MTRIAGNNPYYDFRMMRIGPGGKMVATPYGFTLDSVTHILEQTVPKPFQAGAWYGFRMGLEGVSQFNLSGKTSTAQALEDSLKTQGFSPNANLDKTRIRGYIAHDILELLVAGEEEMALGAAEVESNLYGTKYGWAVVDWWEKNKNSKWLSERPVFSLKHGYAGSADLIYPKREILDLKTHKPAAGFTKPGSGAAYLSDLLQLRAYRLAWSEMGNAAVQGQRVLIARSNGNWLEDTREVPESLWLSCLEMYKEVKQLAV